MKMEMNVGAATAHVVTLRCPSCGHNGAFHGLPQVNDGSWAQNTTTGHTTFQGGVRKCPNLNCNAAVFVVLGTGRPIKTFPPETIDFDATNLPENILATLEEAILCQAAGCHKATALMVRRVLEELCKDKAANGNNLKERLANLQKVAVLPQELLEAADELRLLGNDAAHVEAKEYDAIGKDEADLAIALAKELLKAVYQYANLVQRLKDLKKT